MAPAVAEAQTTHGDDIRFIGVAGQDDSEAMQQFVDDYGLGGFEHIPDTNGDIWVGFGINAQPSYVFLNDDGVAQRHIGGLGPEA